MTSWSPRIGSIASGMGGLCELGLAPYVGGTVAWHAEIDPDASKVLAHHWPKTPNLGNIKETDWPSVEGVDWLTAGWPCQPWSLAGKRAGADDERHLWPYVAYAISTLRPRWFFGENVAGHLSMGFDDVLGSLTALGYDTRFGVVRASDAGAPHQRARLFVVAADTRHGGITDRSRPPGGASGERPPVGPVVGPDGNPAADPGDRLLPAHSRGMEGGPSSGDGASTGSDRGLRDRRQVVPNPEGERSERGWGPRDRGSGSADSHLPVADAAGPRLRRSENPGTGSGHAEKGPRGQQPERGYPAPVPDIEWGSYAPAITRWEQRLGRPAPRPTEPGRNGPRLSARFPEWMMGLPDGHVTDVPGITRSAALRIIGNGVQPQAAQLALSLLLPLLDDH